MANGSKIRRRRNSSNVSPEATSTMRPSMSIPARPLYAQRVPGWKSRGGGAERGRPTRDGAGRPAGRDA